jgi:hypothetical protein
MREVEDEFEAAQRDFSEALRMIAPLWTRLYDSLGYKTYEPDELERLRQSPTPNGDMQMPLGIARILTEALEATGFVWERRCEFEGWGDVSRRVIASLGQLTERTHYRYEAVAYLNAPLIDDAAPITIALLDRTNSNSRVEIAYATDERLAQALGYQVQERVWEGVRAANTVITFPLSIRVDAPAQEFLDAYPRAAWVVAQVVDVLRIAHLGDIGVGALRVVELEPHTPTIRRTAAWSYEPEVTLYQPRRLAFRATADEILSDEEIGLIRALLPVHFTGLDQRGFDVAIRRFRDSYERYQPWEPDRLLDIAIAFEALLLGDSETKEISYRLALRGARWLDDDVDARMHTFQRLQHLYSLRSKIAHGAELSAKDRANLTDLLESAPVLLRRALRRALEGAGPGALTGKALNQWWKNVELGVIDQEVVHRS